MKLVIDPEFQSLAPPLTKEELKQLEENLVRDGCREPLSIWQYHPPDSNGRTYLSKYEDILLDGHNRYELCKRLKIEFGIKFVESVNTRDEARAWIITNQLGRRNLQPYQRAELALKLEPLIAQKAKENQKRGGNSSEVGRQSSDRPLDTKKELAKVAKVSHDTMAKAKVIAKHATEDTKRNLRAGTTTINKEYQRITKAKPKPSVQEPDSTSADFDRRSARDRDRKVVVYLGGVKFQLDSDTTHCMHGHRSFAAGIDALHPLTEQESRFWCCCCSLGHDMRLWKDRPFKPEPCKLAQSKATGAWASHPNPETEKQR